MKLFDSLTKTQKVERWENVLRVLRGLTRHQRRRHWDMGEYGKGTECGTVACAAGHAGMDPWFRRRGLKLTLVDGAFGLRAPYEYRTEVEWFFGSEGTHTIFYDATPRSVGEVIREVRGYLKKLQKE